LSCVGLHEYPPKQNADGPRPDGASLDWLSACESEQLCPGHVNLLFSSGEYRKKFGWLGVIVGNKTQLIQYLMPMPSGFSVKKAIDKL
jgi:hypothetical protein